MYIYIYTYIYIRVYQLPLFFDFPRLFFFSGAFQYKKEACKIPADLINIYYPPVKHF